MYNTNITKFIKYLLPIILGIIIYSLPCPEMLTLKAWKLLAIFIATIIALITKPFSMSIVALISLTISIITNTINEQEALNGFASPVIWLVVLIFFIARAFINSGLGKRIAYFFIIKFGHSPIGISYSLVITELIISPFMPSSAARAGGIIYPIFLSITKSVNDTSNNSNNSNFGSFLAQVCFHANYITSGMFLTAMAANPMIQLFASEKNIDITWTIWALAASVPLAISLFIMPLILYQLSSLKLVSIKNCIPTAKQELEKMGKITSTEKTMLGIFTLMLLMWIFGWKFNINITTSALLGVCLLLITNILSLEDILLEKEAWQTLLWFSILVMLSQQLLKLEVITWFSNILSYYITTTYWTKTFIILVLIYFYSHYFFASITSHVSSMFPAFLSLSIISGTPPLLSVIVLGIVSSLFSSLTHYGSTGAVIFFGSNLVSTKKWWVTGFIMSIVNLFLLSTLGAVWWKFLKIY